MNALYNLLKPVPFDHLHSHAAVKILGKLGGRNRRFQQMPYCRSSIRFRRVPQLSNGDVDPPADLEFALCTVDLELGVDLLPTRLIL
jgi:hypothetical protein